MCPLDCQDSCSWFAHVVDGAVVRMEGAPDHPITRGSLCAKVDDYHTRTYSPDRVLRPLRRIGTKGEARFEPIGWNAALDIIATRFQDIIRAHGPAALLSFDYAGSIGIVQRRALRRIFHALGASRQTGGVCGQSGRVLEDEDTPRGFDPEELVDARLIVLWGCNLLTTAHHTFRFMLEARRRHGARLIAIDTSWLEQLPCLENGGRTWPPPNVLIPALYSPGGQPAYHGVYVEVTPSTKPI